MCIPGVESSGCDPGLNGSLHPTLTGSQPNLAHRVYQDANFPQQSGDQIVRSRQVRSIVAKRIHDRRSRSSSGSEVSKFTAHRGMSVSGKDLARTIESANSSSPQEINLVVYALLSSFGA